MAFIKENNSLVIRKFFFLTMLKILRCTEEKKKDDLWTKDVP